MLPNNLLYRNRKDALGARAYISSVQPQGAQQYSMNDTMIFSIPCNRNTCLSSSDSFLKFTATATNGGVAQDFVRLSKAAAHGYIQRLRLFHNGILLEDIDNYGNLMAQLATHQCSADNISYKGSIQSGWEESCAVIVNPTAGAATSVYSVNAIRGQRISNSSYGAAAGLAIGGVTAARTYCISLVSILGTLTDRYLPLFAMTSGSLRLEVQLVSSPLVPFVAINPMASFTLSNVEFVGSFIELSDQALSIVQQSQMGAPLTMAVNKWSNMVYNASLLNAPTTAVIPIPFKYSSLQAIITTIRQHAAGAVTFDAFGSNHFNLLELYFNCGSETIPSKRLGSSVTGGGDRTSMFQAYCSALGAPADLNYNPAVSLLTYETLAVPQASAETANTAVGNYSSVAGAFAIGMEFVSYPSAEQDGFFGGRNTTSEDIYLNMSFAANATTPAVRFDAYGLCHAVLIFENGQTQIRY